MNIMPYAQEVCSVLDELALPRAFVQSEVDSVCEAWIVLKKPSRWKVARRQFGLRAIFWQLSVPVFAGSRP